MKRIILSLALGLLLINLSNGCSKSDTPTTSDTTAPASTNSAATNAPPTH